MLNLVAHVVISTNFTFAIVAIFIQIKSGGSHVNFIDQFKAGGIVTYFVRFYEA